MTTPIVGPRPSQFDRLVPNAWRVANANDAVTLVPRMLGEPGGRQSACSWYACMLPRARLLLPCLLPAVPSGSCAFCLAQLSSCTHDSWHPKHLHPCCTGYCHIGHKAVLGADGMLELSRECRVTPGCLIAVSAVDARPASSVSFVGQADARSRAPTPPNYNLPTLPSSAGNSSMALGEGADMANVALAAAVNLPKLAEQLLAKQGDDGNNAALLSAAAAVASAASALAAARQEAEDDGEVHTPEEVQAMLEEEMEAMQRLLDGR